MRGTQVSIQNRNSELIGLLHYHDCFVKSGDSLMQLVADSAIIERFGASNCHDGMTVSTARKR